MVQFINRCESPIGGLLIASNGEAITGLWFEGQKYFADTLEREHEEADIQIFRQTREWLGAYFAGINPGAVPPVTLEGSLFRMTVWGILMGIPYGSAITYKEIGARVASKLGLGHMSAQAVGGAVGHNPVSIMVPCHRVLGSDGRLTGYAGGLDKKAYLLRLEGIRYKI
ncbi:MAG: methylated-DNA--[protein]-cysteine S-methyltransferase [Sphaerochaetaceae bacterium]